jgi:type 1 fimbriae regulatory protein FimB
MLRHSTVFYLANKRFDRGFIPDYLGHRNIAHAVKYTRIAGGKFEGRWR